MPINSSAYNLKEIERLNIDITDKANTYISGQNFKNTLVLVHEEASSVLLREDTELLKNILKAVNYTLDDVLIINTAKAPNTQLNFWLKQAHFERVLLFGMEPKPLALNFGLPQYQIFRLFEVPFLAADHLSKINTEKPLKVALWKALKPFFGI